MTDRRDPWPPLPKADALAPISPDDLEPHADTHLVDGRDPFQFGALGANLASSIIQIGQAVDETPPGLGSSTTFADMVSAGSVSVGSGETWKVIAWGTLHAHSDNTFPGWPTARIVIGSNNGSQAENNNEHPETAGISFPMTLAPHHQVLNATSTAVVKLQAHAPAAGDWAAEYVAVSWIAIRVS